MSQTIEDQARAESRTGGGEEVRPAGESTRKEQGRWGAPRCGYRVNATMLWVGTRVLWVGYGLVWVAAVWFYLAVGRARRASVRYLDLMYRARGGVGRRGFLLRGWETYRHMVAFGVLLLDRALMLARPGHGFHIDCEGLEHLRAATDAADGRGVLVLSAHFGMAEIAAPYMRRMGMTRPANIVMYQDVRDGTEQFHARHRHMLEHVTVISTTDPLAAGVKIIAALKKGEVVAMRADRTLVGKAVEVELLGERVNVPAGPFVAAALSGARVVHIYTCRLGYRRYRCMMFPGGIYGEEAGGSRDERVGRAAQEFARVLEGILRRFPHQWSNFYDLWAVQGVREEVTKHEEMRQD